MVAARGAFIICLGLAISACAKTGAPVSQNPELAGTPSPATQVSRRPLSEIDLSKIGHIEPKGRVQDRDYQDLAVVDELIANGKESVPYLISKLDDPKVIHHPVMDFWPELTVGDVAFLVLCDFSLDSTWTKETIPGTNFDEFFGAKRNPDQPASDYDQLKKHGRRWVKAKWQKTWTTYKDRIVWDDKERCFKVV